MEEISFKPSVKLEVIGLIFLFWFIPLTIFLVSSLIRKAFTTYTITKDNEILEQYEFMTKSKKLYRIDQITSISLNQGLLGKIFDLATVRYGIFGNNSLLPAQSTPDRTPGMVRQEFSTIANYKEVFEVMSKIVNVDKSEMQVQEKPSLKPTKFWIFSWVLLIGAIFILAVIGKYLIDKYTGDFGFFAYIIAGVIALFFIIFIISDIIELVKLKSTKYILTKKSLILTYDYFLGRKNVKVPLSKITNTEIRKNLISYGLFRIGGLQVYTGGDNDPYFKGLVKFESFSKAVNNSYSRIQNKHARVYDDDEKPGLITKPGGSFVLGYIIGSTIFFSILAIGAFFLHWIVSLVIGFFWFIGIIMRIILWKNTTYEFYDDKLVDTSGIININTKVIYFKNLKYVTLRRGFLTTERMFGHGSVHLLTAGTGFTDNAVHNIKEFEQIYDGLRDELLED